jgi:hypothetical protein
MYFADTATFRKQHIAFIPGLTDKQKKKYVESWLLGDGCSLKFDPEDGDIFWVET